MKKSNFIFTLDDSNSFSGLLQNSVQEKQKEVEYKMVDQECTISSLFYKMDDQKLITQNYYTPSKQEQLKQQKNEFKFFPIFGDVQKCKKQYNQTQLQQRKVVKLSKKIKKKISLLQNTNTYSSIKIYSKKDLEREINQKQRLKLYDWLMQVCQFLEFSRQTYHKCLNLFEKINNIKKLTAQLTATTCLYMISKLQQNSQRIETFSQITEQFCKIKDIAARELQILIEVKFKINSQTIYTLMQQTILQWNNFLQQNSNIIHFNLEKLRMAGIKFQSIKNFLQLNVFIDYLRIHRITNSYNHSILIICGIYIIIGLNIGQFTFEDLQSKLRMSSYTLTNKIVFHFVKQYFTVVPILDIQICLSQISSKSSILKNISQIYEKVIMRLEENNFFVYKQLHFKKFLE